MNNINKQIGLRLKIARKSIGFKTAILFAQKTKIPKSTYSQHENGERSLTAEQLLYYSDNLEISPGWLLTGLGHPCPTSRNKIKQKAFIDLAVAELQKESKLPILKNLQISVDDNAALVNMDLLSKIFTIAIKALPLNESKVQADELLNFCIEIYNNVEFLLTNEQEKSKIIKLSINSMLRGNKIFPEDNSEKKVSDNL